MDAVRFIAAALHTPPKGWRRQAHSHPHHQLLTVYHGIQHTVLNRGEELDVGPGDVILYGPGVTHEEIPVKHPFEAAWLAFEWESAPRGIEVLSHDSAGRMRQLMIWLCKEKDINSPEAAMARDAYVAAIIAEHQDAARRPAGYDTVRQIREFVREHIAEPLTLADLAREAGMSKYYFLRTYKALTGVTPMADVRALRVEYARELIVATDLPLKAVAQRAGLGTASFLCRLFRSAYGVTPGSLRKYPDEG